MVWLKSFGATRKEGGFVFESEICQIGGHIGKQLNKKWCLTFQPFIILLFLQPLVCTKDIIFHNSFFFVQKQIYFIIVFGDG